MTGFLTIAPLLTEKATLSSALQAAKGCTGILSPDFDTIKLRYRTYGSSPISHISHEKEIGTTRNVTVIFLKLHRADCQLCCLSKSTLKTGYPAIFRGRSAVKADFFQICRISRFNMPD